MPPTEVAAAEALDLGIIEHIHRSTEFMLGLVDYLLDMSKIEARGLSLNTVLSDLDDLVQGNLALNRVLADCKRGRLTYKLKTKLPKISLDGMKIDQVLNNLIGNAIKASPPESTVRVKLSRAPDRDALSFS